MFKIIITHNKVLIRFNKGFSNNPSKKKKNTNNKRRKKESDRWTERKIDCP